MLAAGPGVDVAEKTWAGKQEQGFPSGVNKSPILCVLVSLAKRGGAWPLRPLLLSPCHMSMVSEPLPWEGLKQGQRPPVGGCRTAPTGTTQTKVQAWVELSPGSVPLHR